MMASWDLESLIRDLPRLTTPLILIVGENDLTIPPGDCHLVSRLAPSSRIIRLPNLGHLAHEESPARVAELIASVVSRTGAEIPG
jgi:magnesium chelatase accessory protein